MNYSRFRNQQQPTGRFAADWRGTSDWIGSECCALHMPRIVPTTCRLSRVVRHVIKLVPTHSNSCCRCWLLGRPKATMRGFNGAMASVANLDWIHECCNPSLQLSDGFITFPSSRRCWLRSFACSCSGDFGFTDQEHTCYGGELVSSRTD